MADRIADPWGAATPYARGARWPVRVDTFFEGGLAADEVERWVPTASILHSNGDALDIAVQGGRMVGVRGRADSRVNHGRLGPKDLFGWQANRARDRLTRPLIRRGGELVGCDWDTAMEAVVARSRGLLEEQGPSAFGFYTTGQLFLEEYYTLAVIGKVGIGTNHMDGNTRLCTAAEALKETRVRRAARLLQRRRPLRGAVPGRPQRRRDAGDALGPDARPARGARPAEADRRRPAADGPGPARR
jgi:anaerobic selenocysteine-containing dehydrogenase